MEQHATDGWVLVIRPNIFRRFKVTGPLSLCRLQRLVGGHLEAVPMFERHMDCAAVAFCNEEGKLNGLPYNPVATALWRGQTDVRIDDVLVGTVVVAYGSPAFLEEW